MVEVFCTKCYDTVDTYPELECGHQFCHDCLDPNDCLVVRCLKCKANKRRYAEKAKIPLQEDCSQCVLCEAKMSTKEEPFSCGHSFCKGCLKEYWTARIREGYLRSLAQFTCPHCKKSPALGEIEVQNLIPAPLFILVTDRVLTKNLISCPSCSAIFTFQPGKNPHCVECETEICFYCLQSHDMNAKCYTNDIAAIVGKLLDQDVRYCPFCDEVFMKDRNCDHVRCLSCQREFCYFCMVDYEPIRNHGNSRHRRDCRNHKESNVEVERCGVCRDCEEPEESLEDFVARKGYYMNGEYWRHASAPGQGYGQGLFD